jgi:hypothetical protein
LCCAVCAVCATTVCGDGVMASSVAPFFTDVEVRAVLQFGDGFETHLLLVRCLLETRFLFTEKF